MFMCMCDVSMEIQHAKVQLEMFKYACVCKYIHARSTLDSSNLLSTLTVMSNGIYHPYQLNESTSNCWVKNVNFIRTLNNADPYQTPHSVASGLGLYFPQKGRHAYMSY